MIILGVVLLLVAYLVGIPILYTLGSVFVVVGVLLYLLGYLGHPVGGRPGWY